MLFEYLNGFTLWNFEVTSAGAWLLFFLVTFPCLGLIEPVKGFVTSQFSRFRNKRRVFDQLASGKWHWFPQGSIGNRLVYRKDEQGHFRGFFRNERSIERSTLGEFVERYPGEELWSAQVGVHWGEWATHHQTIDSIPFISITTIADNMLDEYGRDLCEAFLPSALLDWSVKEKRRKREATSPESTLTHKTHGNYQEYLSSPAWKSKRTSALALANNRCQVCNSNRNLQVHHRTYERIFNESPGDLIVLCDRCHSTFHLNGRMPNR